MLKEVKELVASLNIQPEVPLEDRNLIHELNMIARKTKRDVDQLQEFYSAWRRRQDLLLTSSRVKGDGVTTTCDAITMTDKEKPLEDLAG
ncbi:hypothetical protein Tco_0149870 [Tanacetum coccineum]